MYKKLWLFTHVIQLWRLLPMGVVNIGYLFLLLRKAKGENLREEKNLCY